MKNWQETSAELGRVAELSAAARRCALATVTVTALDGSSSYPETAARRIA